MLKSAKQCYAVYFSVEKNWYFRYILNQYASLTMHVISVGMGTDNILFLIKENLYFVQISPNK